MADRAAFLKRFAGDVDDLVAIYEKARDEILLQLAAGAASGVDNQRVRIKKLADIQNLIAKTTDDAQAWASTVIPKAYRDAVLMTRKDIAGAGGQVETSAVFGGIHAAEVKVMANNLVQRFEDIEIYVGRKAQDVYRKATLEAILNKQLGAGAGQTVRDRIVDNLKAEGVGSFVDAAGRNWQIDRYAEMAARTSLRETVTTAQVSETLLDGYDLMEVIGTSVYPDSPCIPFEGETLSLTGRTPGYTTLQEATDAGLFHPNCVHDLAAVISDESELSGDPLTPDEIAAAIPVS